MIKKSIDHSFPEALYKFTLTILLKLFFRLLYREMSFTYDFVAWAVSAGHWSEWVQQATSFVRGTKVLELGFGPGHMLENLSSNGYSVVGIDLSPQMCHRFYQKMIKTSPSQTNGYAKSIDIVCGSGVNIPLKNGVLDTVIATFPTEYIFFRKTADEIFRVLNPGGRLIVILTGYVTGKSFHERFSALLFRLTGQNGPIIDTWQKPYVDAGFLVETRCIELKNSCVGIFLAEKRALE